MLIGWDDEESHCFNYGGRITPPQTVTSCPFLSVYLNNQPFLCSDTPVFLSQHNLIVITVSLLHRPLTTVSMANSSDNRSPNANKDKPDHPTTSVREVAEDQTITNVPSAISVGVRDHPTQTESPPPSSSQSTQADMSQPSSSRRRRSREEKDGEKMNKRRETVFDAPEVPRPCAVCGKQFFSYKALFGHMRSHPGREWRGAFPPPVSSPPREERLVETLLRIGKDILRSTTATHDQQDAVAEGTRRRLDIDLNREPPPPSPSRDEVDTNRLFDLNKDASGGSSSSDAA